MALDPKARKVAMNFPGGTLTATQGLLEAIFGPNLTGAGDAVTRSEERRVGKECRSRWSPYH